MTLDHTANVLKDATLAILAVLAGGWLTAYGLRYWRLRWTWALLGIPLGGLVFGGFARDGVWGSALYACLLGRRWHRLDLAHLSAARARLRRAPHRRCRRAGVRAQRFQGGDRLTIEPPPASGTLGNSQRNHHRAKSGCPSAQDFRQQLFGANLLS